MRSTLAVALVVAMCGAAPIWAKKKSSPRRQQPAQPVRGGVGSALGGSGASLAGSIWQAVRVWPTRRAMCGPARWTMC